MTEAQSPPRPKPRKRNQSNPHEGYTPSHSLRPGVLVEAIQPFNANDNIEMLKWIFRQKLGGNEQVGEITVSHDRTRATVEFYYTKGEYFLTYVATCSMYIHM